MVDEVPEQEKDEVLAAFAAHKGGDRSGGGGHDGPESRLMSTQVSTTGPLGHPRGLGFAILLAIVTLVAAGRA